MSQYYSESQVLGKGTYENWFKIEKAIRKYDRWFNKIEKFDQRAFIDHDNHDRREKRMTTRKSERWLDNYAYFFGGLTEEEQMYRDYYETDLEHDPEDEKFEEYLDELNMVQHKEFNFDNFDFIEDTYDTETTEAINDIVDEKIFKFKYRIANETLSTYGRRQERLVSRSIERAQKRDPEVETDIAALFDKHDRETSVTMQIHNILANTKGQVSQLPETKAIRDYMLHESIEQYKDYYETDAEEQEFFSYVEELPQRDRIRFMEIYEDHTVKKTDGKSFATIPKREFNPELSIFQNLSLDLVDFNDRVTPLASDMSLLDESREFQRHEPSTEEANKLYDYGKKRGYLESTPNQLNTKAYIDSDKSKGIESPSSTSSSSESTSNSESDSKSESD